MSEFLSQEGSLFVNTLKKLSLGVLASGLLIVGATFAQQGSLKQPIPMRVAKQIERLSSPDVRDRRGAALALGEMGQMATAAVGKLIAALRDSEPRVRDVAAWALGLIGDVRAIGPLMASLKDEDGFVRSDAAEALGVINDKRAVEPLIAALKDEWRRVRHSSALALGQIKDPRAVGPLITILTDEKAGGFGEADALAEIGSPAVNPLIAILKDEKETFKARCNSAEVLGEIGDARAIGPLIETFKVRGPRDANGQLAARGTAESIEGPAMRRVHKWERLKGDRALRFSAGWALVQTGQPAVKSLLAAMKDKNIVDRACVIEVLSEIKDGQAVESLLAALKDENANIRWRAAEALGNIKISRAVGPLIAALKDRDPSVRSCAAEALGGIRDTRAVVPLIAAVKDKVDWVARHAAEALGRIGDRRALGPLQAALQDGSFEVRAGAAKALGEMGDVRAGESLIAALTTMRLALAEEDVEAAVETAYALGKMKIKPAVGPLLTILLKHREREVRCAAAWALGEIGDGRAVKPLMVVLKQSGPLSIQWKVAEALAKIGKPAVGPLVAVLGEAAAVDAGDSGLLSIAADALGKIGEPAIDPLMSPLESTSPAARWAAAKALVMIGTRAVDPLMARLGNGDPDVRFSAATALANISRSGESLVDILLVALKSENVNVRCGAVDALGLIGDDRAVEQLIAIIDDQNWQVREAAHVALQRITGRKIGEENLDKAPAKWRDWWEKNKTE